MERRILPVWINSEKVGLQNSVYAVVGWANYTASYGLRSRAKAAVSGHLNALRITKAASISRCSSFLEKRRMRFYLH